MKEKGLDFSSLRFNNPHTEGTDATAQQLKIVENKIRVMTAEKNHNLIMSN